MSRFQMENITLFVPEVILLTSETVILAEGNSSGEFMKELSWKAIEIDERATKTVANQPFNDLFSTKYQVLIKCNVIAVVHDFYNSYKHEQ